jgi:hypothetical protein
MMASYPYFAGISFKLQMEKVPLFNQVDGGEIQQLETASTEFTLEDLSLSTSCFDGYLPDGKTKWKAVEIINE